MSRITSAKIAQAREALERVQKGCSERLLPPEAVDRAVALYREAAAVARRLGKPGEARVELDGGAVGWSYPAHATTTQIVVTAGDVRVRRTKARRGGLVAELGGRSVRVVPCPEGMTAQSSGLPGARRYRGTLRW